MVSAEFSEQDGLVYTRFSGRVKSEEIIEYIIRNTKNKKYPRNLKILTDATGTEFTFPPRELEKIREKIYDNMKNYNFIADAIVTTSPNATALAIMYQGFEQIENYYFKVFSTEKAALEWLSKF